MLIRPELAALRGDDTAQRRAQSAMGAALDRWRALPVVRAIDDDLARWARGHDLDELPALSALVAPGGADAVRFAAGVVDAFLAELVRAPLGQSPLRHYQDDVMASVTGLRQGMAALTLLTIDGQRLQPGGADGSARFAPTETIDVVLAGTARADRVLLRSIEGKRADLAIEPVTLCAGDVSHRLGREESLQFRTAPAGVTLLRLQRRVEGDGITREYALDDGRLLHQAAATPRDSRLELAAALLGRMGRADAAPLLAAMAEESGSPALRWQVLRECLALDAGEGFAALCRIAANPTDPLAVTAGALRAQLIETYPQLAGLAPCPAN